VIALVVAAIAAAVAIPRIIVSPGTDPSNSAPIPETSGPPTATPTIAVYAATGEATHPTEVPTATATATVSASIAPSAPRRRSRHRERRNPPGTSPEPDEPARSAIAAADALGSGVAPRSA